MNKKLKLLLVDDHTLFREGLHFLLSGSEMISEIKEAQNGKDFLACLEEYVPDIVLMDIDMPIMNGIEATQKALTMYPALNVIALSMYADEGYYTEMIDAGAKGFLLKNSQFNDVLSALQEVDSGRNYFSPEILASIIKNLNKKHFAPKPGTFTKRELEVLIKICQGMSNHEIGNALNISKRTVDKHRENILLKTQSKNTAELVVYAIKNGYFEI